MRRAIIFVLGALNSAVAADSCFMQGREQGWFSGTTAADKDIVEQLVADDVFKKDNSRVESLTYCL